MRAKESACFKDFLIVIAHPEKRGTSGLELQHQLVTLFQDKLADMLPPHGNCH